MRFSKRTGWKRPKKFKATKSQALARYADEEVDLFKSDITWRTELKKRRKEGRL